MRTPTRRLLLLSGLYCAVFAATGAVGGLAYFHFGNPRETCASCHEMGGVTSNWLISSHRSVSCRECHGGSLTLDIHQMQTHLDRIVRHFTRDPARPIRLQERHIAALHESCLKCHPRAFADWQASRHATTFARILLDPEHNRTAPPTDDCLRCHGMFYQGDMTELAAAPSAAFASWSLKDPARAGQPVIPCLACHHVHATGRGRTSRPLSFPWRASATAGGPCGSRSTRARASACSATPRPRPASSAARTTARPRACTRA